MSDEQHETPLRREASEEELRTKTEEGVAFFLNKLRKDFGESQPVKDPYTLPEYRREYHKLDHTVALLMVNGRMIEAIKRAPDGNQIPEDELILSRLFIAGHDSVVEKDARGANRRGYNEVESAQLIINWMTEANNSPEGIVYYTERHIALAKEAVLATIPEFTMLNPVEQDASRKLFTVRQPNLKSDSAYSTYLTAMADLADPGIGSTESLLETAVQLAIEDNFFITRRLLTRYRTYDSLATRDTDFAQHKNTLVNAFKFQYGFALGQQVRFEKNVHRFPPGVQAELRGVFSNYDASIRDTKIWYKGVTQLSTEEVFQLSFGTADEKVAVRTKINDLARTVPDTALPQPDQAVLASL